MRKRITGRGLAVTLLAVVAVVAFAAFGDAATNDAAPSNSTPPTISGTPQEGQALSATSGSWNGTTPMSFAYQWRRCDTAGTACSDIAGAKAETYAVQSSDVDHTLRVQVTATNSAGTGQATSDATQKVTAKPSATAPQNTAAPAISGTVTEGQALTVSNGTWTGTSPITYRYEWQRCNGQGVNCAPIAGATTNTYTLTAADVGNKLQVLVMASNAGGESRKYSNQVGPVASAASKTTSGTTTGTTVAAADVKLPDRLVVDRIEYPTGGHSRTPFTVRFHVSDTNGRSVGGALVYTIGLPYGRIATVPEQPTGQDGWVTFTIQPTAQAPRTGYIVQFVRARTPQGDLLAGSSTRRLVQVFVRP
jgi:hypothetical protein